MPAPLFPPRLLTDRIPVTASDTEASSARQTMACEGMTAPVSCDHVLANDSDGRGIFRDRGWGRSAELLFDSLVETSALGVGL